MIVGTPHYMSPEQAAGSAVDPRTDVYAAGVILFQLLTGQVPFDADSFMAILTKHMFEQPPLLGEIRPDEGRPMELEAIVSKAMAKKPDDRFQSMDEFRRALLTAAPAAIAELGTAPPVPFRVTEAPRTSMDTVPSGMLRRRGSRGALYAVIAVALVAIAALGFLLARGGEEPPVDLPERPELPAVEPPVVMPPVVRPGTSEIPAPRPRSAKVQLVSEPADAEVSEAGAPIGRTPMDIDRPADASRTLTLRARDHDPMQIQVGPDSQDTVTVTLQRTARRPGGGGGKRPPSGGGGELQNPFVD
jgi:serine/threonine-protein kinase